MAKDNVAAWEQGELSITMTRREWAGLVRVLNAGVQVLNYRPPRSESEIEVRDELAATVARFGTMFEDAVVGAGALKIDGKVLVVLPGGQA